MSNIKKINKKDTIPKPPIPKYVEGKKILALRKIKPKTPGNKKDLKSDVGKVLTTPIICEFNGKENHATTDLEKIKFNLEELFRADEELEEMKKGTNTTDRKRINELANKFLSKEDIEFAVASAAIFQRPQYESKLFAIQAQIKKLVREILDGNYTMGENEKKINISQVAKQVKESVENAVKNEMKVDEEIEEAEQRPRSSEELENLIFNPENLEEVAKNIEEEKNLEIKKEGKGAESKSTIKTISKKEESGKIMEKKKEEVRYEGKKTKDTGKKVKSDVLLIKEESDIKDPELENILKKIENGDIKLDLRLFTRKSNLDNLNSKNNLYKQSVIKLENDLLGLAKGEFVKADSLDINSCKTIIHSDKKLVLEDSLNSFISVVDKLENVSNIEAHLIVIVKVLGDTVISLQKILKEQLESNKLKEEINRDIQSNIVKGKGNVELKKIINSSYIPEIDWKKLTVIEKELHKLKDWEQFPRYTVWNETMDDTQRQIFFNERIKWNIERLSFLCDLATNSDVSKYEKYGWRTDISVGPALFNQLYYADKYTRGGYCKNFKEMYAKVPKETKEQYIKGRVVAREIAEKLIKDNPFNYFIYRKGIRLVLDDVYWGVEIDKLANEESDRLQEEERVRQAAIRAGKGRGRGAYRGATRGAAIRGGARGGYIGKKRAASGEIPLGEENFTM